MLLAATQAMARKPCRALGRAFEDERFDDATKYIGLTAQALKDYTARLDQGTAILNREPWGGDR